MWKNWNPFRRKSNEEVDNMPHSNGISAGKENTTAVGSRGSPLQESQDNTQLGLSSNQNSPGHKDVVIQNRQQNETVHGNRDLQNSGIGQHAGLFYFKRTGLPNSEEVSGNDESIYQSNRNCTGVELRNQQNAALPLKSGPHRPITSSSLSDHGKSRLSRVSSMKVRQEKRTFTGVHGPLLSTPIVPKVRKALETSVGLRSPQPLLHGKPVGRSSSLNYGSHNPTNSNAGQLPWVRLKRRESLGLSDIVSGNTPRSPNTVKLAAPDQRHLPPAPSFKTTPLIVTTEPSKSRIIDTQTVVSALREKRKRFGVNQQDETLSEDSWINSAKRRRQDSSQSNASSVSIPPMPETLPNLMGTPGASLLHIENLTDRRPSTVPAVDTFMAHHQRRDLGLGGERHDLSSQHQLHQQQKSEMVGNLNSNKTVLRSIQSSLSSSLRARANLSMLQKEGVDLKRIRQMAHSQDASRKISFSSDVTMAYQSFEEPPTKKSDQAPQATTASSATVSTPTAPAAIGAVEQDTTAGLTLTPLKRKIAEGVVLRKHNISLGATGTPTKPAKVLPANILVSASDLESDRQKEYQRRVLDLLDGEEPSDKAGAPTSVVSSAPSLTATTTTTFAGPSLLITPSSSSQGVEASSAATLIAVSASLDSLNKLVQSATAPALSTGDSGGGGSTAVTAANTLSQLLTSFEGTTTSSEQTSTAGTSSSFSGFSTVKGNLVTSPSSAPSDFNIVSSSQTVSSSTPSVFSTTPSAARGLNFSTSQSAATTHQSGNVLTGATGFQVMSNAATFAVAPLSTIVTTSQSATSTAAASFGPSASNIVFNFKPAQSTGASTTTSTSFFTPGPKTGSESGFSMQFGIGQPSNTSVNEVNSSLVTSQPTQTKGATVVGGNTGLSSFTNLPTQPVPFTFTSSSTQQPFMNSQTTPGFAFTGQSTTSVASMPTFGLNLSSTAPSVSVTSTSIPLSSLGNSGYGKAPTLSSGFSFTQGANTSQSLPAFNVASSTMSSKPSTLSSAFTFGIPSSTTSTSSQQLSGVFNFGHPNAKPSLLSSTDSSSTAISVGQGSMFSLGATGFSTPQSQGFTGLGANTQTTSTSSLTGSIPQPQSLFGISQPASTALGQSTGVTGFGTQSTQLNQPLFGAQPAFSAFVAATTTQSSGTFAFGQTSLNTTSSKPFAFGMTLAPGGTNPFSNQTSTTTQGSAPNLFASGVSTTASSLFGNTPAPVFGATNTTSPFGSAVPTTAPPPFGSAVPTTAPPPFGSAVPTTAPPPFGSFASGISAFGTSSNQATPVFGKAAPSSNQPFPFGMSTPAAQQQQQASSFGSNTSTVFGNSAHSSASSVFGAKTTPSIFGAASAGSTFGEPNQPSTTTTTTTTVTGSLFGTSFGPPPAFGAQTGQAQKPFGISGSGFSTPATPVFGANTQNTGFGSAAQNPASPFGTQPAANPSGNTSLFGTAANTANLGVFGAAKPNPFSATATTQAGFNFSASQPQQTNAFGTQNTSLGSAAFNFGQAAAQPQAAGAPNGFNFASQTPNSGGFNFTSAVNSGPTFNFTATPSNMFSPSTPTSAPRVRNPTKRATARRGRR